MTPDRRPAPGSDDGLPEWAVGVAQRIRFLMRRRRGGRAARRTLAQARMALRRRAAEPGGAEPVLRAFLQTSLTLFAEAARAQPDFAAFHDEVDLRCALARAALDGDADDRPLLARESEAPEMPGRVFLALRIPARVVWLAAMARGVSGEERGAATMLASDLASLRRDMPLRALQAARRG